MSRRDRYALAGVFLGLTSWAFVMALEAGRGVSAAAAQGWTGRAVAYGVTLLTSVAALIVGADIVRQMVRGDWRR